MYNLHCRSGGGMHAAIKDAAPSAIMNQEPDAMNATGDDQGDDHPTAGESRETSEMDGFDEYLNGAFPPPAANDDDANDVGGIDRGGTSGRNDEIEIRSSSSGSDGDDDGEGEVEIVDPPAPPPTSSLASSASGGYGYAPGGAPYATAAVNMNNSNSGGGGNTINGGASSQHRPWQYPSSAYAAATSSSMQPTQPTPQMQAVEVPTDHRPTWMDILPRDYYQRPGNGGVLTRHNSSGGGGHGGVQNGFNSHHASPPPSSLGGGRKKITLSLINMWEFTITVESLDGMYGGGYYDGGGYGYSGGYGYGYAAQATTTGSTECVPGLRASIKKIARGHVGRDGRSGAVFEREGVSGEDPLLRDKGDSGGGGDAVSDGGGRGRWRIPLGSYHALMTYLQSAPAAAGKLIVEGIPPEQLRVATLGRERRDRAYATVDDLASRDVFRVIADALAPYQRGGVEFILDRGGRALLADEMGLGKTVQAIAAMSAYRERDWPLLVLCPSTARYHWEAEFRGWMGSEAKMRVELERKKKSEANGEGAATTTTTRDICFPGDRHNPKRKDDSDGIFLDNSQINVLTSGRDDIIKNSSTKVVICSIGLIVNLVSSGCIHPGMFRSIIVDESHSLKSKSTKRTKSVLPLLLAAERCLLLSGTPALARPSELWPQLSVLGGRRGNEEGGVWCNEAEFTEKYVKPKGEDNNKTKLAELHTMLTSTVMIRRMKADILKNLPAKLREKAYVNLTDQGLRNEFQTYMALLRQGKGVMGKLARAHHKDADNPSDVHTEHHYQQQDDSAKKSKEVLHHLYKLTGQSKIARVTKMLQQWLADPTKGKLCIFAHHLDVLDSISSGASLSNAKGSTTKYIRIDGSTSPKARQEQILKFQTDPSVRVAILGITAAGVAVTLTASSTVWFSELFWTPAIMIQAEDRCHRIGQQARVRCLYFVARETLDEVLWKLIEKKFRDLGQFVEGKDNEVIHLERELDDEENDEILKRESDDEQSDSESGKGGTNKKRKAQDVFNDLFDADEDLKKEMDELVHEEEDMLNIKNEEEEDIEADGAANDNGNTAAVGKAAARGDNVKSEQHQQQQGSSAADTVIELSGDEEDEDTAGPTISSIRELFQSTGIFHSLKIEPTVPMKKLHMYTLKYLGPTYGLIMVACNGRVVVKSHHNSEHGGQDLIPKIGSIIVGVSGYLIPYGATFVKVLQLMKHMMRTPPVTVMFAEDDEFTSMFLEDFLPNLPNRQQVPANRPHLSNGQHLPHSNQQQQRNSEEVIELSDDD